MLNYLEHLLEGIQNKIDYIKDFWNGPVVEFWNNHFSNRQKLVFKNSVHETAHLALLALGATNSLAGIGWLNAFGWNTGAYSIISFSADLIGIMYFAIPYCILSVIIYTMLKKDVLCGRNHWALHAIISMGPPSVLSFALSILGLLPFTQSSNIFFQSAVASAIGSAFYLCNLFITIGTFTLTSNILKKHPNTFDRDSQTTSISKRLLHNLFFEAICILGVLIYGLLSSQSGLSTIDIFEKFNKHEYYRIICCDLIGVSIVTIPLGLLYTTINTFFQKIDALKQSSKYIPHSALRFTPALLYMPNMTILGNIIAYGGQDISLFAASNATGTFEVTSGILLIVTGISIIDKNYHTIKAYFRRRDGRNQINIEFVNPVTIDMASRYFPSEMTISRNNPNLVTALNINVPPACIMPPPAINTHYGPPPPPPQLSLPTLPPPPYPYPALTEYQDPDPEFGLDIWRRVP